MAGVDDWLTVERSSEPSPALEPSAWPHLPDTWDLAEDFDYQSRPTSEQKPTSYAAVARSSGMPVPPRPVVAPASAHLTTWVETTRPQQPRRERPIPRWDDAFARKPNEVQLNALHM
mmetsp:Transcript_4647/g.12372  ORF Transcript_4647/g.12372 Transcript_4647/m.12372 type:complete len:117 (-) Transcript_4647:388-738(-)